VGELGWKLGDLLNEELGPTNPTGRLSFRELILTDRLRSALRKLNPALSTDALLAAEIALRVRPETLSRIAQLS
jgi:type I restriction enzyme, R subunit